MLTRSKYSKWWASLIVAIATIAAGIFLIRNAFNLASLITRIAGGILVFDGVSDLWVVSRISKVSKDLAAEASAVDSEATVTEAGADSSQNADAGDTAQTAAETQDQHTAGDNALQPPIQPEESSTVPEYMEQTEQNTDFSAFAGTDSAENRPDDDKQL